jgi:protoheme IX farnesyltransferase
VLYLVGAIVLGLGFIYHAVQLFVREGDEHAMPTFAYSIFYLTSVFALLLADHYLWTMIGLWK